jgi:serine kinase of HPr protein (carbohydrate metabolism regulator)
MSAQAEPREAAKGRQADRPAEGIHATAVVVGEWGILIRGHSGAGKSGLARALIASAGSKRFARLVGDDRVLIEVRGNRIMVRPHAAIAGRIEIRGQGVVDADYEQAAVLHALVDLASPAAEIMARMPEKSCLVAGLSGVELPRLTVPAGRPAADAAADVIAFLDRQLGNYTK